MATSRSLVLLLAAVIGVAGPAAEPAFVLQNETCRYAVGPDGTNAYFGTPDGRHNLCEPGHPFMQVCLGGQAFGASSVQAEQSSVRVEFGGSGVVVRVRAEATPNHLALTVTEVLGQEIQWLQLVSLRLNITQNVGTLVNAAWDEQYAACVLACNDRTHAFGADGARAFLCAQCYPEFGTVGARAAIIGLPTGAPDPDRQLLAAIGRVEVSEGLPHPMLNGVWIKESPDRLRSYLMVHDLGEANVDEVIRIARGGFGCIEFYPWRSTPSYELNPALFPNGLAGLKTACDKIHAADMQVGLHVMQGMVGWGSKDDRYIVPRADPRLLQDRRGVLDADVNEGATTLLLRDGTSDWPEQGDLYVDGEIIRYATRTETGFAQCQRGFHRTTAAPHAAGTPVGHLVNCFPIWGGTVYCPDLQTNMPDEICDRLAEAFNAVSADMSYFDGGEELVVQPPHWRTIGTFALGVQRRLTKPVFLGGNACYTHLSWHVITRGSPHYDPIHFGRREYTLRFKGTNPANHAKNLLTGDVGWFAPHPHSLTADAVTPDEVLLLCLKAVGGKAPISFSVSAANLWTNERMAEMLEIIRACDELKQCEYFSPAALAELARPRAEHHLEQLVDGQWHLRPLKFGPPCTVNAASEARAQAVYENPYEAQTPFIRVRARTQLAPFGDPGNVVLADPAQGNPFALGGTATPELAQQIQPATETTPSGDAALSYRVSNGGDRPSGWTKIAAKLEEARDISRHRRLGLWVKSSGGEGILNVQLAGTDARRDHYVPLNVTGWQYVELETPEDARFWDYSWPVSWTDLFYTDRSIYNATSELDLYFNGVTARSQIECIFGRIEALRELPGPLRSPTLELENASIEFPADLQPDEYVELDFAGRCRHFDPNGKVLAELTPRGSITLQKGPNHWRLGCLTQGECTTRAEVSFGVRDAPLAGARREAFAGQTDRYPSLAAPK